MERTILIVDDDAHSREVLRDMLEHAGYRVEEAEDGKNALERLIETPVDVILTDRAMPHLDGMGLLKTLQERGSTVPVVMISGYGEEKLWGEALSLGAADYLLKPFKVEDVLKVVKRCLKKTKPA